VVIDLDTDTMLNKDLAPRLPNKERKKLIRKLEKYADLKDTDHLDGFPEKDSIPITVREAFPLGIEAKRTSESTISVTRSNDSIYTPRASRSISRDIMRRPSIIGRMSRKSTGNASQYAERDYTPPGTSVLTDRSSVVEAAPLIKEIVPKKVDGDHSTSSSPSTVNRKGANGFFSRRLSTSDRHSDGFHLRNSTSGTDHSPRRSIGNTGSPRAQYDLSSSDESNYSSHSKMISMSSQSLHENYCVVLRANGHLFHDAMEDSELLAALNNNNNVIQCQFCKGFSDGDPDFLKCSGMFSFDC
jgi:hypothetical protein